MKNLYRKDNEFYFQRKPPEYFFDNEEIKWQANILSDFSKRRISARFSVIFVREFWEIAFSLSYKSM